MVNKYHLACLCAFGICLSALTGQEPPAPLPAIPLPKAEETLPPPKPAASDPTIPSPKMQELLQPRPGVGPAAASNKFPSISLKGRVVSKIRQPVVLLDIDGKTYAVGQGVAIMSQNNQIIKVVEITTTDVKIQVDGSAIFALN